MTRIEIGKKFTAPGAPADGPGPTFTMIFEDDESKPGVSRRAIYKIDGLVVNEADYNLALATVIA